MCIPPVTCSSPNWHSTGCCSSSDHWHWSLLWSHWRENSVFRTGGFFAPEALGVGIFWVSYEVLLSCQYRRTRGATLSRQCHWIGGDVPPSLHTHFESSLVEPALSLCPVLDVDMCMFAKAHFRFLCPRSSPQWNRELCLSSFAQLLTDDPVSGVKDYSPHHYASVNTGNLEKFTCICLRYSRSLLKKTIAKNK